jgi:hypothetical protein
VTYYSQRQIADFRSKILAKINFEIDIAIKNDFLEEFLEKYGISIENEEPQILVTKRMKILVLGGLAGKVKDYQVAAKRKGINPENIEFIDYQDAKNLNAERLRYSFEYSDIIYGPTPHKVKGMGDISSLLSLIEEHPNQYPKLIKAYANNKLKITISGFADYLKKTRYYEAMANL